jgi:hypothetical protein
MTETHRPRCRCPKPGAKYPALQGIYLYADYILGTTYGLRETYGKVSAYGTEQAISGAPGMCAANFVFTRLDDGG